MDNVGIVVESLDEAIDSYKHFTALGFSDSTYPNVPFYDGVKLTSLKYSRLPKYDCEK